MSNKRQVNKQHALGIAFYTNAIHTSMHIHDSGVSTIFPSLLFIHKISVIAIALIRASDRFRL